MRAHLPPSLLTAHLSSALASALNKTGAFAKNAPLPVNPGPPININSGAGAAADLLTMTSRLKELMDPSNPNCLPPPPVDGYGGAPVPSDDDMLNVAQVKGQVSAAVCDGRLMHCPCRCCMRSRLEAAMVTGWCALAFEQRVCCSMRDA